MYEMQKLSEYKTEFTITIRLEAKSEKGPRNHFSGDGMLEDVTHASSPDWPLVNMFCPDDIKNSRL